MRIISQDGMKKIFDFPYERSIVYILPNDNVIRLQPIGEAESDYVVAKYSTEAKAKKAMDMLHITYKGNKVEEVYQEGTNYYHPTFQFPADEDVEV